MSTLAPAACQLGELSLSTLPRTIHPKRNPHLGNTETAANDETHKKGQRASVEPKEPILERLPRTARSLIGRDDTAYHRRARPQGRSSNTLAVRPSQSRDRENPPRPLARMVTACPGQLTGLHDPAPGPSLSPLLGGPQVFEEFRARRPGAEGGQQPRHFRGDLDTAHSAGVCTFGTTETPIPTSGNRESDGGFDGSPSRPNTFSAAPRIQTETPPGHRVGGFSCLDPH
jgi:hypothetical protein